MSPKKGDILVVKRNYSKGDQEVEIQEDHSNALYITLYFGKVYVNELTVKNYELTKLVKPSIVNRLKKYNY